MFKNKLRDYRIMRGLSQTKLAELIGTSRSSVSMYESGDRKPSFEVLEAIADVLNASFNDLMGVNERQYLANERGEAPILGVIHCGEPVLCDENIEGYVTVPEGIRCDYALRCKGVSMTGAGIEDGDLVYIRQQETVETGEIAAVMVDGETTLKRVYVEDGTISLMPANPAFSPRFFSGEAAASVRVIGKAVGFTHYIEKERSLKK